MQLIRNQQIAGSNPSVPIQYCRVAERESGVVTWRFMSVRFRSLQLWGLSSLGRTSALQAEEAGSKPAVLHSYVPVG